jgi:Leucine-rich repeat (LRR) protein
LRGTSFARGVESPKNNILNGSIPDSLGKLVNLQYLNISHNQLSGSIPNSLGNLVKLQSLVLGYEQLSGSIPDSLGNLVVCLLA